MRFFLFFVPPGVTAKSLEIQIFYKKKTLLNQKMHHRSSKTQSWKLFLHEDNCEDNWQDVLMAGSKSLSLNKCIFLLP